MFNVTFCSLYDVVQTASNKSMVYLSIIPIKKKRNWVMMTG